MSESTRTLRLMMPQWQGGDSEGQSVGEVYPMGARLLAFLAPQSDAPLIEVPVDPYVGAERERSNGVMWQDTVLRQFRSAMNIIQENQPDRIITFGGDCLVSQAPFAYLNERYDGKLGVLWIDAHPDVTTPKDYDREHAMVLGNLLGGGDPVLAQEVSRPLKPEHVMLVGVNDPLPHEIATIKAFGLQRALAADVMSNSDVVTVWVRDSGIEHIAIHFDLDSLDPQFFYSQLLRNPNTDKPFETATGKLRLQQVSRLINDVSAATDVVGMTFAEHMPWDALHLQQMMASFSFMR